MTHMSVRTSSGTSVTFRIFCFTAYSSYLVQMQIGSIILDVSLHNGSKPHFCSGGAVKACPLKSSNQFTAFISHPIELKLGRMISDISPLNRAEPDPSLSFRGAVGAFCMKYSSIRFDLQPTFLIRSS